MRRKKLHTAILTTAFILSMGISISSQAAENGWKLENNAWSYLRNGAKVTNEWIKTNNFWFYVDSDGSMARNSKIENRYVNEDGAMVSNSWRKLREDGEESWYYFTQNGNMAEDGWKTINNKKYHFDSDGSMDYGWYDDNQYYLGTEDDGAMKTGWTTIPGPEGSTYENEDGHYYFSSNGIVTKDKIGKKINSYTYSFDEHGRMLFGWVDVTSKVMAGEDSSSSDIRDYQYYKDDMLASGIDGSRLTGWRQMDPPDGISSNADDTPWYYFKDGAPYAAEHDEYVIKSIKSKKYCFNQSGEMLTGFQYLSDSGANTGTTSNASTDDTSLYYFGSKNDGAMKTGTMTLYNEETDEKHTYYFTTNGKGYTGLKSDSLYFKGKRLDAQKDLKYQAASVDGVTRLVNTSGKVQKASSGKTKVFTDTDGRTFTVTSTGEITSQLTSDYPVIVE